MAWSASSTCFECRSASEYTATDRTPRRLRVRMTRQAISPRLAIRTVSNIVERRRTRRIRKPEDPNRFVDITGSGVLLAYQGLNPDLPRLARALGLPDSSGSIGCVGEGSGVGGQGLVERGWRGGKE